MVSLVACNASDPTTRRPTTTTGAGLHIAEVDFADLTQADDRYLRVLDEAVDGGRSLDGWRRRDATRRIAAEAEEFVEANGELDDATVLAVWEHTSGQVAVQLTGSLVDESPITVTVLFVPG